MAMADLAALMDEIRRSGERLAERFWVRWYRSTGRWTARWRRFDSWWHLRWAMIAEGSWSVWYRILGWLARQREGLVRHNRIGARSRPVRRSSTHARRRAGPALSVAGAGVYLAVVVTIANLSQGVSVTASPTPVPRTGRSPAAAAGIDIPDVRGMSASEARRWLEDAGLTFGGAEATLGTPGQVIRTQPEVGRIVPASTAVTVVIGVEAERIAGG
jgi:hypothetical protein